jgi:hypothetical protein
MSKGLFIDQSHLKSFSSLFCISFFMNAISNILVHNNSESEFILTVFLYSDSPYFNLYFLSISSLWIFIQSHVFKGSLIFHQSSSSMKFD